VGSFTRYYAGDWELVAARVAREIGAKFQVARQHNPPDAIRDPEEIRRIVLEWRSGLAASLSSHLPEPLAWDESPTSPYFTDKPTWDGYIGLALWAAYEENPKLRIPVELPDDFDKDPAIKRSMNTGSRTAYPDISLLLRPACGSVHACGSKELFFSFALTRRKGSLRGQANTSSKTHCSHSCGRSHAVRVG